jgi:hypothetical protein
MDRQVLREHGASSQLAVAGGVGGAVEALQLRDHLGRVGDRRLGDGVDARHPGHLRGAVRLDPRRIVGTRLGPGPPPVVRVIHVELGHRGERILLVGDRGVDHLQHEDALAGVRRHAYPPVADAELSVGHGHQRRSAGVAEQDDRVGAAPLHLVVGRPDVDDAVLVHAVDVVVDVARREPEHGVSGRGEQRAGVVHAEVAARVREDHRRLPGPAVGGRPQHAAHERSVG